MASKRKCQFQWSRNQRNWKYRKIDSKCLKSVSIESYNSIVKLFESRSLLRKMSCTKAKISKYHILEAENNIQDICHKIIRTNVGTNDKNINFDNIIPTISPILDKFKALHIRFKYFDELKYIMEKERKKPIKKKYKGQVHICLLKSFFGFMFYKNVPLELFGTWQNFKAVKKTIHCLLKTCPKKIMIEPSSKKNINKIINRNKNTTIATRSGKKITAIGGLLSIEPLLKKLDISKIEWLYPLKNIQEKWIMILKLLHWFFAQYIIKILHKYIVLLSIKQQWVYIKKDDWCEMQDIFISEKISKGDLVLIKTTNKQMSKQTKVQTELQYKLKCIRTYRLVASSSGLRVIARCYDEKKSYEISIILRFLQQLYCTYFNEEGLLTVQSCIQQVFKFKRSTKDHLYYVRCDIQDAFGSINQEKLFDIIKTCCMRHLPIYLRMRKCTKKNTKKQRLEEIMQCLDLKELKNVLSSDEKPQLTKWIKLTSKIKKLLLEQQIELYGKVYSIKTGVPQGLRLSPIFSDIYYQNMFNNLFVQFKNSGVLCRYVDDILYVTKEKNYAEEFLKIVRSGIPEYNVKFNPNKIQTNVELPFYKKTKVKYLGKNIFI
ncbi:telomerase reverse transcriptase-like [Harpegnathos saltator]|uniref:telomerase reverse transcriptase-like n=1 Tax=Harpegnathos saltator TaxID=610380 RepID=UPI000948914C|nr:telomerase reverse transcriptase-like [Harpegnathos saltator]